MEKRDEMMIEGESARDEQADDLRPRPPMRRALGLKEAAELLAVSYSTVYTHRKALGFFQIGNQWRVWPETLREMTERGAAIESRPAAKAICASAKAISTHDLSYAAREAAASKELDELLARPIKKRTAKR
ncbi:MAG TPA: helix-turn-helix domain-containing protein [Trinickia sp.]|uniref:helix-turn-helix domain-containing protein n=1 Tax=Trinickia sp. TaxID=2571163 RepID=UPI002C236B3F|nr:helix-turn-helix domain-containing protein [Trinickia sp.]HVW50816.1 helix-turn-helix domain-containing protein [Trinickia sp.]